MFDAWKEAYSARQERNRLVDVLDTLKKLLRLEPSCPEELIITEVEDRLSGWEDIEDGDVPTQDLLILGFDVFYADFYLCAWGGKYNGKGQPHILPLDGTDDCYIRYWRELPAPPKSEVEP